MCTVIKKAHVLLIALGCALALTWALTHKATPLGIGSNLNNSFFIAAAVQQDPIEARMYGMTGLLGRFFRFSTGVDTALVLVAKQHKTVKTYPRSHWQKYAVLATAIANYRIKPQPIILSGHSLGGNATMWIAHRLNEQGIPVAAIFSYDQTPYAACVPSNVIAAIGWQASRPGLGGGIVRRCPGNTKTAIENHRILGDHVYVDDAPSVHKETASHVGDIIHMLHEMKGK